MLFKPPQIQRGSLHRSTGVHILDEGLRCVTFNIGGRLGSQSSSQSSKEQKHKCFSRLVDNNIICFQEIVGKDEFLHALQVLALGY